VAVSPDAAHGQVLAACGFEFAIAPGGADMPDSSRMLARAPLAAELCEIPVQVTLAEAPPLSDLDVGQFGAYRFDASRATVWIRRPALEAAWQIEALHGPVLLRALAQRGLATGRPAGRIHRRQWRWQINARTGCCRSRLAARGGRSAADRLSSRQDRCPAALAAAQACARRSVPSHCRASCASGRTGATDARIGDKP